MPTTTITALTGAGTLTGTEVVPVDQSGTTVKATTQAIANLAPAHTHVASDITSGAITSSGMTLATDRVLGRTSAGSGTIQELQPDDGSVILTGGNIRGRLVQRVFAGATAVVSTTSTGAPTWNIGAVVVSASITPKSASNNILVRVAIPVCYTSSATGFIYCALYKNGTGTNPPTKYGGANNAQSNGAVSVALEYNETAGTTSSVTWSVRMHSNLGGSTTYSGFDTSSLPSIVIEEWAS